MLPGRRPANGNIWVAERVFEVRFQRKSHKTALQTSKISRLRRAISPNDYIDNEYVYLLQNFGDKNRREAANFFFWR